MIALIVCMSVCVFVFIVNYHGSTGFGQDGITSLLGEVGKLDVHETHVSILYARVCVCTCVCASVCLSVCVCVCVGMALCG